MNETNTVQGSGTPSDPLIFHYHQAPQHYSMVQMMLILTIVVVGFLMGFFYGKSRKPSN